MKSLLKIVTACIDAFCKQEGLSGFLRQQLGKQYEVQEHKAATDPDDSLKHDIVIISDRQKEFKKLDILMTNFEWEDEGLSSMEMSHSGPLHPYPRPYLISMKLMAGSAQDLEDIRGLLLTMTDTEKETALRVAHRIRRDDNLSKLMSDTF